MTFYSSTPGWQATKNNYRWAVKDYGEVDDERSTTSDFWARNLMRLGVRASVPLSPPGEMATTCSTAGAERLMAALGARSSSRAATAASARSRFNSALALALAPVLLLSLLLLLLLPPPPPVLLLPLPPATTSPPLRTLGRAASAGALPSTRPAAGADTVPSTGSAVGAGAVPSTRPAEAGSSRPAPVVRVATPRPSGLPDAAPHSCALGASCENSCMCCCSCWYLLQSWTRGKKNYSSSSSSSKSNKTSTSSPVSGTCQCSASRANRPHSPRRALRARLEPAARRARRAPHAGQRPSAPSAWRHTTDVLPMRSAANLPHGHQVPTALRAGAPPDGRLG